MMTRKETVEQALNHKEGKVPVDFGGTTNTGIHCRLVRKTPRLLWSGTTTGQSD